MIVLGAGARGMDAYAPYALIAPDQLQIVGVAEPRETRRNAFAARYGLPENAIFSDWRDALNAGIDADAVLVATQDNEHV
jgi:predicted dehydrogenase